MSLAVILCLSDPDEILLYTCPVIACVSSVIRAWIGEINLRKLPPFKKVPVEASDQKFKQTEESKFQRAFAVMGIAFAGALVGFAVACMFLGAIQPTSSAIGRVWLLAIILGVSLPIVINRIDQKAEKILNAK